MSRKSNFLTPPVSVGPARKFIITVFMSCYAITTAPIIYFLYKNYLVLDEVGFKFFPTLLDINHQDKMTVAILIISTFIFSFGIQLIALNYFLSRIYKPISLVQDHMAHLIHGNFFQPTVPIKQEIYARDFLRTYNYLYVSLQTNLRKDITYLREIEENSSTSSAKYLINEKLGQLEKSRDIKPNDVLHHQAVS